jgi:aryl-alcohol dehydrogenase-like predicted oxidoreductase
MIEDSILPALREAGVGVTAYGVLSRGLISTATVAGDDARASVLPALRRRQSQAQRRAGAKLGEIAKARGITVAQLAIAWVLGRGDDIVPLVGARRRDRLTEALGALDDHAGESELKAIDKVAPEGAIAGTRYAAEQMHMLDSER